jgi:hypothetical protein
MQRLGMLQFRLGLKPIFGGGSLGAAMALPDLVCPVGNDFAGRLRFNLAALRSSCGFQQRLI